MMSPVKQSNEKAQSVTCLETIKKSDVVFIDSAEKSQKDTERLIQLEISVETYKTLARIAMKEGIGVEELVARAVTSLAEE